VQDDEADFTLECSMMANVYAKALCTIVAADSPDGDGGCFPPRDSNRTQCSIQAANFHIPYRPHLLMDCIFGRPSGEPEKAEVTIYADPGPWIKGIQNGPVSTRGWCLQEREMSPRVLFFTHGRLMWECQTCTASEDEPRLQSKSFNTGLVARLSSSRALDTDQPYTIAKNRAGVQESVDKWQLLVEDFSRRGLSVPKDKLVAISGLVATVAERRPAKDVDKYLAGKVKHLPAIQPPCDPL
jgi:hypothetical protein